MAYFIPLLFVIKNLSHGFFPNFLGFCYVCFKEFWQMVASKVLMLIGSLLIIIKSIAGLTLLISGYVCNQTKT